MDVRWHDLMRIMCLPRTMTSHLDPVASSSGAVCQQRGGGAQRTVCVQLPYEAKTAAVFRGEMASCIAGAESVVQPAQGASTCAFPVTCGGGGIWWLSA